MKALTILTNKELTELKNSLQKAAHGDLLNFSLQMIDDMERLKKSTNELLMRTTHASPQ